MQKLCSAGLFVFWTVGDAGPYSLTGGSICKEPRRQYNQTKRINEYARQRASADCSANVLRVAKQGASYRLARGKVRNEYLLFAVFMV